MTVAVVVLTIGLGSVKHLRVISAVNNGPDKAEVTLSGDLAGNVELLVKIEVSSE